MNTKKTIISIALAGSLILPAATSAKMDHCSRFSDKSSELKKHIADSEEKIYAAQEAYLPNLRQRRADRDARLVEQRAQADARRTEQFSKIPEKTAFKAAIVSAVAARKTAVDAAMNTFRDGLDQAVDAHTTEIQNIVHTYKTAVYAAIEQEKSDCAGGAAPAAVRATFLASMKKARDTMQDDRKNLEKLGPQLETLVRTRNAAVQKAMDDFRTALEKARTK